MYLFSHMLTKCADVTLHSGRYDYLAQMLARKYTTLDTELSIAIVCRHPNFHRIYQDSQLRVLICSFNSVYIFSVGYFSFVF